MAFPCNPHKLCNNELYIRVNIFSQYDDNLSVDHNHNKFWEKIKQNVKGPLNSVAIVTTQLNDFPYS